MPSSVTRPAARPARSYGKGAAPVQTIARLTALAAAGALLLLAASPSRLPAADPPVKIVALGDSLTAGYGLGPADAFPARLERALKAKGLTVEISNAGVSGDTTAGGAARLDWSVPEGTDAVILELGANDALRGIDPQASRQALEDILRRLEARHIAVLIAGMRAPPNMGRDYVGAFEAIFPDLAKASGAILYPFFLDGVAADRTLNQPDGVHPTAQGVETIVRRILPKVEELIARVKAKRAS